MKSEVNSAIGRVKTAIVGCGQISGIYLQNLMGSFSKWVEVTACGDLIRERAEKRASEFNVPRVMEPEDIYLDDGIEMIVCLTNSPAHHYVCKKALENGKHAYMEKTFGITLNEGKELLDIAHKNNLYAGGAPDTFLGAGLSTCRHLLDDGWIGQPISATACLCRGVFSAAPSWLWEKGAGPLFDMGPYYLTALAALLGKIDYVTGITQVPFKNRSTVVPDGATGAMLPEVPTHVDALIRFACGADALFTTTFDVRTSGKEDYLEINGTEGTLLLPDPNFFHGPVKFFRKNMTEFMEIPLLYDFTENARGLGVADMARAIRLGIKARADASMCFHVLEIFTRIIDAGEKQSYEKVGSGFTRPEAVPKNYAAELCVNEKLG
jgi:predicted dehydrogenase